MNATSPTDQIQPTELLGSVPADAELDVLRRRLASRAEHEGLLDVGYRCLDSPLGPLLVASTAAGVVRVAFETEDHDAVLGSLAAAISPRVLRSERRNDVVARQLDEYFDGRRRSFDVSIDLRLVTGFRRVVIESLRGIEFGTTRSYAEVASAAGNPRAVRAAGSACAHNPVPVVIPCHRVVRSDGSIGQYLGGAARKSQLLALEAAA